MAITAKVLAESIKNKTIVLTGAMIPIKFGSSDGLFNLGSAMAFVQSLPPGVYVAMNGRYFSWDNVRKNKQTGILKRSIKLSELGGFLGFMGLVGRRAYVLTYLTGRQGRSLLNVLPAYP